MSGSSVAFKKIFSASRNPFFLDDVHLTGCFKLEVDLSGFFNDLTADLRFFKIRTAADRTVIANQNGVGGADRIGDDLSQLNVFFGRNKAGRKRNAAAQQLAHFFGDGRNIAFLRGSCHGVRRVHVDDGADVLAAVHNSTMDFTLAGGEMMTGDNRAVRGKHNQIIRRHGLVLDL